jgi:DnaJ homologue, subfamily C, member 28, conserved domain
MTERKPPQMKFQTWIDQQVADAERRGVFDDLPGKGKPLNIKPGAADGDYGQAWLRDYARREGVPAEEMLPTPLRLRRELERLAETAGEFRSEAEVREAAADLNRRIVEWRRIPLGPPVHVRLANADDLVARWRAANKAREAAGREARAAAAAEDAVASGARPARPRRLRRWRRRPR